MTNSAVRAGDAEALLDAIQRAVATIEIDGPISDLQTLKLPPGTNLRGLGDNAELRFRKGQPGLVLTADHEVGGLRLVTDDTQIAFANPLWSMAPGGYRNRAKQSRI